MPGNDAITLDQIRAWCETHEKVLRWQYGGALPVSWEAELREFPPDTTGKAIERLALLKHFYRKRHEEQERRHNPDEATQREAARQLLRREPEIVQLESGRTVKVTGRSYAAMIELAAHEGRIRLLQEDLDYIRARYGQIATGPQPWLKRRRWARRLEALYRRTATELLRHRERLYAHATTESGAAARPDEPAPAWWSETTPMDDARILLALYRVGPMRYANLGELPEPEGKGKQSENWGYDGLLAAWGVKTKAPVAEMFDRDLGALLAEIRLSAPAAASAEAED